MIEYNAVDIAGNPATPITRTVNVSAPVGSDVMPPVVTLS